jgi:3-methyl-2-oxobutanoate hydroxymethyltransferase
LGGYKVQARDEKTARQLIADAKALVEAGASLLVLECVPAELAREVSEGSTIPTIGIGAGAATDGQVLVLYDMLGLTAKQPRFSKDFLAETGRPSAAIRRYVDEVRGGRFPGLEHQA